jgi:hypothetical protein
MLLPATAAAALLLPISPSSLLPVAAMPLLRCRCNPAPVPQSPRLLPLLLVAVAAAANLRATAAAFVPVVLVAALLLLYKLPRCRCYPSPRCRCCFFSVAAHVTVGAAVLPDSAMRLLSTSVLAAFQTESQTDPAEAESRASQRPARRARILPEGAPSASPGPHPLLLGFGGLSTQLCRLSPPRWSRVTEN